MSPSPPSEHTRRAWVATVKQSAGLKNRSSSITQSYSKTQINKNSGTEKMFNENILQKCYIFCNIFLLYILMFENLSFVSKICLFLILGKKMLKNTQITAEPPKKYEHQQKISGGISSLILQNSRDQDFF